MDKKQIQIVIVVVCLIAAAAFLAYSMGLFSGGPAGKGKDASEGGPIIEQVQPAETP